MTPLDGGWSQPHLVADREHAPWFTACEGRPGVDRVVGLGSDGDPAPARTARVCGADDGGRWTSEPRRA